MWCTEKKRPSNSVGKADLYLLYNTSVDKINHFLYLTRLAVQGNIKFVRLYGAPRKTDRPSPYYTDLQLDCPCIPASVLFSSVELTGRNFWHILMKLSRFICFGPRNGLNRSRVSITFHTTPYFREALH